MYSADAREDRRVFVAGTERERLDGQLDVLPRDGAEGLELSPVGERPREPLEIQQFLYRSRRNGERDTEREECQPVAGTLSPR